MKNILKSKNPNLALYLSKFISVLLVLVLAFSIFPSCLGQLVFAAGSGTVEDPYTFTDSFDSALDSGWTWITSNETAYPTPAVTGGTIAILSGDSRVSERLLRPASEASLNQTVSIDFDITEMTSSNRPILFARVQDGSTYSGYSLFPNPPSPQGSIFLQAIVNGSVVSSNEYKTYNVLTTTYANQTVRLELKVESVDASTTNLTINFYTVSNGIATIKHSKTLQDTTADLQKSGRAGVGSQGSVNLYDFSYVGSSPSAGGDEEGGDDEGGESTPSYEVSGDFTDAFSTELSSDWEWVTSNETSYPRPSVADGVVNVRSSANRITERLLRPASEAAINQTVSIDYDNSSPSSANRPILVSRVKDTTNFTGYIAFANPGSTDGVIYIWGYDNGTNVLQQQFKPSSNLFTANSGTPLRFELSTYGTYPTYLSVRLYTIANDGVTTLIYESDVIADNTAELQQAGKAGFGTQGTLAIDNFIYNYISDTRYSATADGRTLVNYDDFSRNEYMGENWTATNAAPTIADGIISYPSASRTNARILRPFAESYVNQTVSVDFKVDGSSTGKRPVLVLRAQNADTYASYLVFPAIASGDINIQKLVGTSASFLDGTDEYGNDNGQFDISDYGLFSGFKDEDENWFDATFKLEATVYGTSPTYIVARLYRYIDGALALCYESPVYVDNTSNLQAAGTAGFAIEGGGSIDSFTYTTTAMGDVNGDNEIDARDLVRYKKYLVDDTITIDNIGARIDDDDSKNNALDLAALRNKILNF